MFRVSPPSTMPDIFSNIYGQLDSTRQKQLSDENGWHNLFYKHVTSQIDERLFACLFSKRMGAPNAEIRILVAMIILKEGFGWSDEQLFMEANFNLRIMCCLGLNNVTDRVPCMATYYNFKKAVYRHQIETGEDLIGEVFEQLTRSQSEFFGVNGKFARMDSKLIGSNIAKCSRLQLILSVVKVFYKDIVEKGLVDLLSIEDKERLEGWSKKSVGQIVYPLDNEEKEVLLQELGYLLLRLQSRFSEKDSSKYHLIVRVLSEQYSIKGERVILLEGKEIKSDSLQSPYDEDAAYRKKEDQQIQGYSVNITETCNKGELNLITNVKVEKVNYSDNNFLQGAIRESEKIVGHIENLNVDGGYHSLENQEFLKTNGTNLILGGLQGRESNYDINIKSEKEVEVINKKTGEIHQAEQYKEGSYKIKENGKWRYFTKAFISSYLLRKQIEQIPQSERSRRNNVEASIFQFCYHMRNNKTRYRGLLQHQMFAYGRCMWINFVRIKNYVTSMGEVCPDGKKKVKNQEILTKFDELLTKTTEIFQSGEEILTCLIKKSLSGIPKMIFAFSRA